MQGVATHPAPSIGQGHPRRGLLPRNLGRHAAAAVAAALPPPAKPQPRPYDGALPIIGVGAVDPLIERSPKGVSVDLVYAMADGGFQAKLPRKGCSPTEWLGRAIQAVVDARLPAGSLPLVVSVNPPCIEDGSPTIALEVPPTEGLVVPLLPGMKALRNSDACAAACSILNSSPYVMGPSRFFSEVEHLFWQGENSEEQIAQEYQDQGEQYDGFKRADWDEVYPLWATDPTRQQVREGRKILRRIAGGRGKAAPLAGALLRLALAERKANRLSRGKFYADPSEVFEYDSWLSWGVPLIWSRDENVSAHVLDTMYNYAMQQSTDFSTMALQIPPLEEGAKRMREFRASFEAQLEEYAAASDVCRALMSLEDQDA